MSLFVVPDYFVLFSPHVCACANGVRSATQAYLIQNLMTAKWLAAHQREAASQQQHQLHQRYLQRAAPPATAAGPRPADAAAPGTVAEGSEQQRAASGGAAGPSSTLVTRTYHRPGVLG